MRELVSLDAGGDANRAYVILDRAAGVAWCVDPSFAGAAIMALCQGAGCRLTEVFLTHTHGDHIATLPDLRPTGVRVWVHASERVRLPSSTQLPAEGDVPEVPGVSFVETPGHTPGGVCYIVDGDLFTGDVLFVDWVGRSDFAGGDPRALFESLGRLRSLPPGLRIRPGHNYGAVESRTLGDEIGANKFLACTDYDEFLSLLPELSE